MGSSVIFVAGWAECHVGSVPVQKTSFSVWGPFVLTLLCDQKNLGLGGLSQACSHTCTQNIWKGCVWTHKYKPYHGLWHPWLFLKLHLSQNLSRIGSWEIAQLTWHPNLSWVLHLFCPAEVSVGKEQKRGITSIKMEKCNSYTLFPEYFLAYCSRSL